MELTGAALFAFGAVCCAISSTDGSLIRLSGRRTLSFDQRSRALRLGLGIVLALVATALLWDAGVLAVAVAGAGAALVVVVNQLVRTWRQRVLRRRRQRAAIELCDALAAELAGGVPSLRAVQRSCLHYSEWAPVLTAARLGGDIGAALRSTGQLPGAEGLQAIAAGWEVAAQSGAAQAVVLDRIAAGLRSDDEARAEVTASLGPPRATAKLLAVLPVLGLGLGMSLGADPLQFLLHTGAGLLCLSGGVVLAATGLLWVERLARAIEG